MRRTTLWTALIFGLVLAHCSTAIAGRTLEATISRGGATTLGLDTAVGDVIISRGSGEDLHVTITLTARKGGFFSSLKKSERQVERASLSTERHGTRIDLEIKGPSEESRFEAKWIVTVPSDLALELDMGVGDLRVSGIEGNIDVDLGVGDVTVKGADGEISIDVGVGNIALSASAAPFGTVTCSTGVGDVLVTIDDEKHEGEGMISKDLEWKGPGEHSMDLDTGVGDIRVTLSHRPPEHDESS